MIKTTQQLFHEFSEFWDDLDARLKSDQSRRDLSQVHFHSTARNAAACVMIDSPTQSICGGVDPVFVFRKLFREKVAHLDGEFPDNSVNNNIRD